MIILLLNIPEIIRYIKVLKINMIFEFHKMNEPLYFFLNIWKYFENKYKYKYNIKINILTK